MKILFTLMLLITTSVAFAHEDHMLGEGVFHLTYHLVFWTLFIGAVYKGLTLFIKAKKKANNK